jgi:hypothetical protein
MGHPVVVVLSDVAHTEPTENKFHPKPSKTKAKSLVKPQNRPTSSIQTT